MHVFLVIILLHSCHNHSGQSGLQNRPLTKYFVYRNFFMGSGIYARVNLFSQNERASATSE